MFYWHRINQIKSRRLDGLRTTPAFLRVRHIKLLASLLNAIHPTSSAMLILIPPPPYLPKPSQPLPNPPYADLQHVFHTIILACLIMIDLLVTGIFALPQHPTFLTIPFIHFIPFILYVVFYPSYVLSSPLAKTEHLYYNTPANPGAADSSPRRFLCGILTTYLLYPPDSSNPS